MSLYLVYKYAIHNINTNIMYKVEYNLCTKWDVLIYLANTFGYLKLNRGF